MRASSPSGDVCGAGLAGDARGITVGANLIQPCRARAGHHKTAREQRVPGAFLHKLCLACQQRFVYLQRPVRNNGVRAHLATRAQQHNVVQYQLVCGDGARSAAPRTTQAVLPESSVTLSSVRLTRSSCTMPMNTLAATMPKNIMSRYAPTANRQAASATNTKLKKVNTLSRTICHSVLERLSCAALFHPGGPGAGPPVPL